MYPDAGPGSMAAFPELGFMSDGFHLLDIVFFAMVAAFLVLRLRSVLGRRTGNERPPQERLRPSPPHGEPQDDAGNVIDLARARRPVPEPAADTPLGQGIAAIRAVDRNFTPESFLAGASRAFEMIVGAYAAGDKRGLRPLLADDVFANFAGAIDQRERAGESLETELVGIRSADLVDVRLVNGQALVTVRFVSEQVNVLRDMQAAVVEGDPGRVVDHIDEWTFARDTRSPDPNWELVATRSPDPTPNA